MPDKLEEIFQMQEALNKRIGVETAGMTEEEKIKWVLNYLRAMQQETCRPSPIGNSNPEIASKFLHQKGVLPTNQKKQSECLRWLREAESPRF